MLQMFTRSPNAVHTAYTKWKRLLPVIIISSQRLSVENRSS
jgi:hypothetical protein